MKRSRVLLLAAVAVACTSSPTAVPTPSPTTVNATPSPSASPSPSPSPDPPPTPEPTGQATTPNEQRPVNTGFDASRALALASELAGMGHRDAGTPGDRVARAWLRDRWEEAGWSVRGESFDLPQGGTTSNVVAVQDVGDLDRPHIVIGGHLDTRNQSPGANDNASGIGVLISAAEGLAGDFGVPIVLVGFGAEEYQPAEPRLHHLGSDDYAQRHGENVLGAFIVDMVGNGSATCICWFDLGPRTMAERMKAVADQAGFAGFRVESRGDISDHGPFARRGIPAAFLWTYDDGRFHTSADTAEHLQVNDIQRAGDLTLQFARTLSAADRDGLRPTP